MFQRWQTMIGNFISIEVYLMLLALAVVSSCPSLLLSGGHAQMMLLVILPFQLLILIIVVLFVALSIKNIRMLAQSIVVLFPFLVILAANVIRLLAF